MTSLHPVLESALAGARRRFLGLAFLRRLAWLGIATAGAVLALGAAMRLGWVAGTMTAVGLFALLFALATLALPVLAIAALATRRSTAWSAGHVENANPSLLDRLHALVFLGSRTAKDDPVLDAYAGRIERQAIREMTFAARPFEDEKRRVVRLWLVCLLVAVLTVFFYVRFHPFSYLGQGTRTTRTAAVEEPFLEEPIADAAELQEERQAPPWGEVRITEPGRDLTVTKVDAVPLQIEAAASLPIAGAGWVTALTGAEPEERPLPPPEEPRFAVYQPVLYVDELRLADWDVVTYWAEASTAADDYASELYFLEVRPFREEIEKLEQSGPGGSWMGQCSGLIDRQKHVLRQTHRFLARPEPDEELRRQDQEKLAAAEEDLAEAARHLYAEMAAKGENQAIGVVLDHLAKAEEELDAATAALVEDPSTAPPPEQRALAELVATRKSLQRAISENPEAMGGSGDEEPFPIAELPEQLKQISEFRDEEKAALELLDQVLEEERRIGDEIERDPSPRRMNELAPRQEEAADRLDQFAADHPSLFDGARDETAAARDAMDATGEALDQGDADLAGERQGEAEAALEDLRRAVERQAAARQLGDAYRLKEMIDREAARMGEIESDPGAASAAEAAASAEGAKEATRELKEMMEGSPVGQGFGPELHQSLSDARQGERERDLDAVGDAVGEAARSRAAGKAREGLEEVSDAFEQSAPRLVKELRQEDALAPGDAEALEAAIRQLQALLGRREGPAPRGEDDARRREALLNLRQGLERLEDDRERVAVLLEEAEETLVRDEEVDSAKLRRLLEELERFRTELGGVEVEELELDLAHVDPSKLPAEYRERIQSYFRKLSEQ